MARDVSDGSLVESRADLVAWLEAGCKPEARWRVGTEHEKIPFYRRDLAPVPYTGSEGRGGIRALLEGLRDASGWAPITDGEAMIGLEDDAGGGAISLEPGGQFELSGAPLADVHATAAEFGAHLDLLRPIATHHDIAFLDLGMSPKWTLPQTPVMPKRRYEIMAGYMPTVGTRGLDMMFRTATVQTNLDFSSEADMVKKLRVSIALQPIAAALCANSPFLDGRPNGCLSGRSQVWLDVDRARSGLMPFAFEPGMGFERYVDYALDVPLYFVKRGGHYHDVSGASFRDLMAGRLAALPGERATLADWANHLSTIFPEVRMKRYLEMRGADMGPASHVPALAALFVGLLYDTGALGAATDLVKDWDVETRQSLRDDVPTLGLRARAGGRTAGEVAADMIDIAQAGLKSRRRLNRKDEDESRWLAPFEDIVARKATRADELQGAYAHGWGGQIDAAFTACVL